MCDGLQVDSATASDTRKDNSRPSYTLKLRGGSDTYIKKDGSIGTAGKGALVQVNKSATLGVTQDQYVFVPIIKEKNHDE